MKCFRQLKKSKKALRTKHIFVVRFDDLGFFWGRIIDPDVELWGGFRGPLIYIYNRCTASKDAVPELPKTELLVPPLFTNRLSWSRGYFETVANRTLTPEEILSQHCFSAWSADGVEYYVDENGKRLPRRTEPCGQYGVCGVEYVEHQMADVLGRPLSDDE